jgi:very-short-patch-repair endonuclease
VDLSSLLSSADLARACHEAGVLHGTTPRQVEGVLKTRPTTPGAKRLRKVMRGDVHVTLSALERKFLKRLDEAGLPRPVTNKPAGEKRVDCRWPQHNLTVELDSYRYHNSRHAWELDRRRERQAHARGDDFRRYTRDDVFEQPEAMLAELRTLLRVAKG